MQAGDLLFIRGKGVVPDLIRAFDKGEFNHVAVAVSSTHIVEAEWYKKLNIVPFEYSDYEIVRLPLTDQQRLHTVLEAVDLCGLWYDYKEILGIVLGKRKAFNDPNKLICSEATATILFKIGYDKNFSLFTPNELYADIITREGVTHEKGSKKA